MDGDLAANERSQRAQPKVAFEMEVTTEIRGQHHPVASIAPL
jgi:hypothetical protein